eukprot:CAMPEP_0183733208 /NCGR_PEP_ID=MMETSP0737-20130205/40477_1 /TAXON_ID=385413 /ORGANISM="Thalassiosira miniscula, Strain CCMP1093" /LENGTH=384 /DNA_ID=CAMNT_0025966413 /DNA_START=441 /DNA_END=1594 /DNA_ORIENTATION=+
MKQFDRQRGGPRDLAMSWKQPYRLGKESLALPASSSQMDEIMGIVKKPSSLQMSEIPRKDEEEVSSATITWHKILFFSDMIFGLDLLVVFSLSCIVTLLVHNLKSENVWLSLLPESKGAIATLGAFYSFALVFRTNICYARWWEGRTLWGTLIVYSIRIAQQGHVSHWKLIDDRLLNILIFIAVALIFLHIALDENEALSHRLGYLAVTFAYACKAQLRGNKIEHDEEDGPELVRKGIISQEEMDVIARQTAWQPYYCIDAMRAAINEGLKMGRGSPDEWKQNAAACAMEDTICTLASSIGGCIRVKSTGLPVAYDDIMYTTGGIFFVAACLAWAPGCGFYTPAVVIIVYIIVKMIVAVGSDMEDPFGHDESDLPLEKFCAEIE